MKKRKAVFGILICLGAALSSCASFAGGLYRGDQADPIQNQVSWDEALKDVRAGSVVVLGEIHDNPAHHENQRLVLEKLERALSGSAGAATTPISVGLEFFERQYQSKVDQYVAGSLAEDVFLKTIRWGTGIPFDFYRQQVGFPKEHGGSVVALNASRELTGKIAKSGLASLSDVEKSELPPSFELGGALYFERFSETMKEHAKPEAIQRYFEAQSTWDDTMAWTASEFIAAHPDQVLVILVGDFHASYGGGLPARLRARGVKDLTVFSQVDGTDLSPEELRELVGAHPKWGKRADFVFASF